MAKKLYMKSKNFLKIAHIKIFYSNNLSILHPTYKITNKTYDNGTKTSEEVITDTPEKAYFSMEGQDMNDPDWDKIEGFNS